jgi:cytochrome c peroxidase
MKFACKVRYFRAILVSGVLAALLPGAVEAQNGPTKKELIERGRELFNNETFDGNGRTCATCHPATNNFTIDPAFIATLPKSDPLFVAETNPALAKLEDSKALRQHALVTENLDGMDRPGVLRGVPHTLALPVSITPDADEDSDTVFPDGSRPVHALGWTADGSPNDGSLRQFAVGAVVQHLTKTMDRVEGVDFRLPTKAELDALEAFQRSLGRQEEVDLAALTFVDDAAQHGKDLFEGVGANRACTACHANAGANVVNDENPKGFNDNFDTGTRLLGTGPNDGGFGQDHQAGMPGFGNGTFNTPPLIEAADTAPFFHNNSAATLEDSIRFYTTPTFAKSPSGAFGGAFVLNNAAIANIAAFLRALNARENAQSAFVGVVDARRKRDNSELLQAVAADIQDGIEVLEASKLAPDAVDAFEDAAKLIADAATRPQALGEAQRILRRIPSMIAVENKTVAAN